MTHKLARFIPVLALVLSISAVAQTGTAAPAAAPVAGPAKVGIINVQAAIVSTNEGQRDFQGLQKKFDPKRTEIEGLGKQVDDLKKQLSAQGDKLNDDARAQLVKQIEQKQKVLQREYEDANNELQAQQNEIASRIGQKMMQMLEKYARENGYTVVLDAGSQQSSVLWATQAADITQAIVDSYNVESGVPAQPRPAGAPAAGTAAPKTATPPARPAGAATKPTPK
ncbi:MAG TPA: OmpH family outer membrane protein [Clostridia bacterium]|nr:OmpH family outer membrane protein [Clostridia bacterium]